MLLIQCVAHFKAKVGSRSVSQCLDCDKVREGCVNASSATCFLGPPWPTKKEEKKTKKTTHLSCWPHIVLFFDNRFSYIMNPIHIKGWTRDRLALLQAPQNGPKPHGRTNSSLFFPLSPALCHTTKDIKCERMDMCC